jgi:hypothetical protein
MAETAFDADHNGFVHFVRDNIPDPFFAMALP